MANGYNFRGLTLRNPFTGQLYGPGANTGGIRGEFVPNLEAQSEQAVADYKTEQEALRNMYMNMQGPFANPLVQSTLSNLSSSGPFARRGLGNIRSQAATNLRSTESKIGAALGSRGISGSPEAALLSKAGAENLLSRLSAENSLLTGFETARAGFLAPLAQADTALKQAQTAALSAEEIPFVDPIEREQALRMMEAFDRAMSQLYSSAPTNFLDVLTSLLPAFGLPQTVLNL